MTTTKKTNAFTCIIDTIKEFHCKPVCGREERAEYRRKKSLRKKAVSIAVAVMVFTLLTGGMLFAFAKNTSEDSIIYSSVAVEEGDTLWSIAKDNFPDSDPRDVIQEIREINDMDTHTIYAGMTLLIPAN